MSDPESLSGPRPQPVSAALMFGREWLRAPLLVGAVAPSGAALARAMTAGMSATDGPVIELGPGTGVFTQALLNRGIPAGQIAAIEAIEASERFAAALATSTPA